MAESTVDELDVRIREDRARRMAFREESHSCPMCGAPGLIPLGGNRTCWFECSCGAYSALSPTWEEALSNTQGWQNVDPGLNARMVPPVGGA